MSMLKEFKEFIIRGNVLDLAVGVIIGGAFATIISSLVDDVITPLLLAPALKAAHAEKLDQLAWGVVKYGNLLAATLKFVIVAFVLFAILKMVNKFIARKDVVAGPSSTDLLLMEIRDALKK